eukprot:GHVS01010356.1.p1 GENE.GHVS01010356.1~~GHVS01010356.1.p1  ORF type:complete len:353 (+),score=96.75 GHVS01010356.1:92-1150(+)
METPSFCKIKPTTSSLDISDGTINRHNPPVDHSSPTGKCSSPIKQMIQQQLSPDQPCCSLSPKEEPSFLRVAVFLLALGQLVLLAALLAALGFLFHLVVNKTTLASMTPTTAFDGQQVQHRLLPSALLGVNGGSGFVDLSSLSTVPIEQLQTMHSLVMKWPQKEDAVGGGGEYLFHVLSAVRNNKVTTLHLSADSKLVTDKERAILLDSQGEEIGRVDFSPPVVTTTSPPPATTSSSRRLGRLMARLADEGVGRYPRNSEMGNPESAFDAQCRYGCGKVAVTFPYYYRPFFGYGFPLVGTEAMFPQGYGGYPGADLMAHQGAGVVSAAQQQQQQFQMPPTAGRPPPRRPGMY